MPWMTCSVAGTPCKGHLTSIELTYIATGVGLEIMRPADRTDSVTFTIKGQVVVPKWLRERMGIERGTRALVYEENGHIVLKPMTAQSYAKIRGSLKGTRCFDVFMAERRREREL